MLGQFVINGLISGILYSLLAIGFALVYNTTKVFHIAAAAIYVFAAYIFYLFAVTFGSPIIVSALIAILLTMGLSLLTDVSVYRPLKNREASNNVAMVASIGMMTVIVNLLAMIFGNETKMIDNATHHLFSLGDAIITTPQMWQLVVGIIIIIIFFLFIAKTPWGIRLRALSSDSVLYETLGYNTSHTRIFVFLLSGAFIAISSCLAAYDTGLNPHMGMNVIINAMVAMIIGGMGRLGTCVLGGITLGLLQGITAYKFSENWLNAATFVLLLTLLFIRPQGIAGYKQRNV
ncbi:MAG: branched-chain amino acid ABC transporter permease [Bacteroidales bacterium]|nr:branched-chain amino acid ABC transporter permease [Bacteroidales bacterium]